MSILRSLFSDHLQSQISSKVIKYMQQTFSRFWGYTIQFLQGLEHKLTGVTIDAHMKCYIRTNMGYTINHGVAIEKVGPKEIQIRVTYVLQVLKVLKIKLKLFRLRRARTGGFENIW